MWKTASIEQVYDHLIKTSEDTDWENGTSIPDGLIERMEELSLTCEWVDEETIYGIFPASEDSKKADKENIFFFSMPEEDMIEYMRCDKVEEFCSDYVEVLDGLLEDDS